MRGDGELFVVSVVFNFLNNRPIQSCYLCGTTENLTNDHVPPESFFPPPLPTNLITVRCCNKCNNGMSLDDEAFLIWITTGAELNDKGMWILRNKIAPKLQKKSKLRENVKKFIKKESVQLPSGTVELPLSYFPDERGDRFMTRLTKGFLRHFYPQYDYSQDKFDIYCIRPHNENERNVTLQLVHGNNLVRDTRGDGVVNFWHRLTAEGKGGAWVFCFYHSAVLLVLHTPKNIGELI